MKRFHNQLVAVFTLVTVFLPSKGLTELSRRLGWMAFSRYERPQVASSSVGIGGLRIDVTQKIAISSSDLSYKNGYLYANLKNRALKIPVSSIELEEAIQLVQNSNERIFETSLDQIRVPEVQLLLGTFPYISKPLQGTKFLSYLFLAADQEFAGLVQERIKMPVTNIRHPYSQALDLLNTDAQYQALPNQWTTPPLSWPQLYIIFDPNAQGLIGLNFNPQVLFRSSSSYPVEVDSQYQTVGENPYQPLTEDVKKHPNLYREVLPIVDRAASITAVLGLVSSACYQPKSCQNLLVSPAANEERQLEEIYNNLSQNESKIEPQSLQKLINRWQELSLRDFQPSQSRESWAAAYDAVWIAIENPNLRNRALKIAARQFLTQTVPPNDALLQAAASVVFVAQGGQDNLAKAQQSLENAINLSSSSNYYGEQNKVARLGLAVSGIMDFLGMKEANEVDTKSKKLLVSSSLQSYKYIDSYLENCMTNPSSCSSEDLRTKEADTASIDWKISLYFEKDIDIAWLYGRFAYLVGLKEPASRINRLRLLSQYAQVAKTEEHRQKLKQLVINLAKN
jgi:hypothetical protein